MQQLYFRLSKLRRYYCYKIFGKKNVIWKLRTDDNWYNIVKKMSGGAI